jgi:hypothetical protein
MGDFMLSGEPVTKRNHGKVFKSSEVSKVTFPANAVVQHDDLRRIICKYCGNQNLTHREQCWSCGAGLDINNTITVGAGSDLEKWSKMFCDGVISANEFRERMGFEKLPFKYESVRALGDATDKRVITGYDYDAMDAATRQAVVGALERKGIFRLPK